MDGRKCWIRQRRRAEGGGEKRIVPGAALDIKNKSHNSFVLLDDFLLCLFFSFLLSDLLSCSLSAEYSWTLYTHACWGGGTCVTVHLEKANIVLFLS